MARTTTDKSPQPAERTWFFIFALALILLGLSGSIYLTILDVRVLLSNGNPVSSFCAINQTLDCVTVASSKYALFLGVPIAVYGVEFFLAALGLLILSRFRFWPLKSWGSYLFWFSASSLPVIGILAYISAALIGSLCLVCLIVHGANFILLISLIIANRSRLSKLAMQGFKEFWISLKSRRIIQIVFPLVLLPAVSQFFWMPYVLPSPEPASKNTRLSKNELPFNGMTLGAANAPIRIEVFTDYQCPFCDKANFSLLSVVAKYPKAFYIRHRDYPLDISCNPNIEKPFHDNACNAALYARCASAQNKFWQMDALLFENRMSLAETNLRLFAAQAGLNMEQLDECLKNPATLDAIQNDIQEAVERGVRGTPAFFINGEMTVGYKPPEFWEQLIGRLKSAR